MGLIGIVYHFQCATRMSFLSPNWSYTFHASIFTGYKGIGRWRFTAIRTVLFALCFQLPVPFFKFSYPFRLFLGIVFKYCIPCFFFSKCFIIFFDKGYNGIRIAGAFFSYEFVVPCHIS